MSLPTLCTMAIDFWSWLTLFSCRNCWYCVVLMERSSPSGMRISWLRPETATLEQPAKVARTMARAVSLMTWAWERLIPRPFIARRDVVKRACMIPPRRSVLQVLGQEIERPLPGLVFELGIVVAPGFVAEGMTR